MGGVRLKKPPSIYLESASYDWFGRGQVARSGFDSR